MARLQLTGITKRYGDFKAADDVSLDIADGEFLVLLGPSGCGKTTTLRIVAGFIEPSSGSVRLGERDITALPPWKRNAGLVFQSYALFPHMTVAENIAFGLEMRKMPKAEMAPKIAEALRLVRLDHLGDRLPRQLSGGQQQRVALARSLAKKPQLLLLDEPLGALDKKLRQRTQFELVNIIESVGVTVVMVTHDQEEAMTMASRIAVMSHGRVLQVGTPKEIYECPINRFVADFIGNINLFDGQLSVDEQDRCEITTGQGIMHIAHGIGGAIGMPLTVAVRPEKIYIAKTRPDVSVNLFSGKVREIAYFGSYTSFVVETASGRTVVITEPNGSRLENIDITWEDQVFFWWDEADPVVLTQ